MKFLLLSLLGDFDCSGSQKVIEYDNTDFWVDGRYFAFHAPTYLSLIFNHKTPHFIAPKT